MTTQGFVLADKYRIDREIDGGAMGRVFAAVQLGLDRPVAVKVMREVGDDFRSRFLLEARSLASLNHRNVVSIIDSGETPDGLVFIVMEYLQGRTLHEALRREQRLDVPRVVQLAIQIARGLRAAHRQGIVHRDLKPSNIFLIDDDEGGEIVKLLDFGVARALDAGQRAASSRLTREGIIVGTPTYMSPEAIKSDGDGRADLYSLGCVMYEMLSGRPPFVAVNGPLDVLAAHVRNEPDRLTKHAPWVPGGLEALVMRLLRKRPEQRYANAEALLEGLKEQLALIFNDPFRPVLTDPSMDAIPLVRTPTPASAFASPFPPSFSLAAPPSPAANPTRPVALADVTAVDLDVTLDPSLEPSAAEQQANATATLPLPRPFYDDDDGAVRLWSRLRGALSRLRSTWGARFVRR